MRIQMIEHPKQAVLAALGTNRGHWYAVQVRAKHEKKIDSTLQLKGFETYLPLVSRVHQWSDRKMKIDLPIFSCYVFVKVDCVAEVAKALYQSSGFLSIVGENGRGTAIPEREIEEIRQLLSSKLPFTQFPFLKIGQRVRVCGGPLDGVEGILTEQKGSQRLVISVAAIQGSLAVRVEGYNLKPV